MNEQVLMSKDLNPRQNLTRNTFGKTMKTIEVKGGVFIGMTPSEAEQNCKLGQLESCCAFLSMMGDVGFGCCRMTPLANQIIEKLEAGLMNAKGRGGWSGCYWEKELR